VAFESSANTLVSDDTNNKIDVFVHDHQTGQTSRISIASDGTQGNDTSTRSSISVDGRYVTFDSDASNLVSDDTNNRSDVFVYDRQTGQTSRISITSDGTQGDNSSWSPSISADGRYVAFESTAWLVDCSGGGYCGGIHIFVHDRQTSQTTRISVASDGTEGGSSSSLYTSNSISNDGRYVAFSSDADNLISGDTNFDVDIFVHDQETGQTTRVSIASDGIQGNGDSMYPSVSADGRYIAFHSDASNLVSGDTNNRSDIFVYDRQTGQTNRISVTSDGNQGNGDSVYPSISADGRYIAFHSDASNLVSEDTNGESDVFVHDRQTGQTTRVSVASDGTQGNDGAGNPAISTDGRYVAFSSNADNLVIGDTNGVGDIFVHDRGIGSGTAIDDLTSKPENSGEIKLSWTTPSDPDIAEFDIRYSNTPINESNWDSAIQVSGEPTPVPGSAHSMTLSLITGRRWYFGLKIIDAQGIPSPLSNVPSILDTGFRSKPDGYNFENTFFPNPLDFTIGEGMVRMFGEDAVCNSVHFNFCIPKKTALDWWRDIVDTNLGEIIEGEGRCFGMASTSLRFFAGLDEPANYQPGATNTYALSKSNARENIIYYQISQLANPVSREINASQNKLPSVILAELVENMSHEINDLSQIFFSHPSSGSHGVSTFAIEEKPSGEFWVYVYDNNHPDDDNRYIIINPSANTWSYDLGGSFSIWHGGEGTNNPNSIGIVPNSVNNVPDGGYECPFCDEASSARNQSVQAATKSTVLLNGSGHLLITNSTGQRIGYEGEIFINEIAGAFGNTIIDGSGIPHEPIYNLPLEDNYTILLDGETITETTEVSVSKFGPGYAVSLDNVNLNPNDTDQMMISSDGKQIVFAATAEKQADLGVALDGTEESSKYELQNVDIGAGKEISLTVNSNTTELVFETGDNSGEYNLIVEVANGTGEHSFMHSNIIIHSTDSHYIRYGDWDGEGEMEICVDEGSTGQIDSCTMLENEINKIYLPIIIKN